MKQYPSIEGIAKILRDHDYLDEECFAFEKPDGSNIRCEWSRKRGWYKFGTRRTMFNADTPFWGQIVPLWHDQMEFLDHAFRSRKVFAKAESIIVFAEFHGKESFAGQHVDNDPKKLTLFDVNIHKKGFIDPEIFLGEFGEFSNVVKLVHRGLLTPEFISSIRDSSLEEMGEGVVVKGGSGHKRWMTKIKTKAWVEKVKNLYPSTWNQYHDSNDEVPANF